jgi:hypothetical protein
VTETQKRGVSKATDRRCSDLIVQLHQEKVIPFPFSIEEFLSRFQSWRGRHIRLEQVNVDQLAADLPCGTLVRTTTTDYIYCLPGITPLHREHIIVHEIAHMLFEHESSVSVSALGPILFPDLDPRLIQQVLCRAAYTTKEELEAEIFASLFLQQTHRSSSSASRTPPASAPVLDRVENAWGRSRRWPQ